MFRPDGLGALELSVEEKYASQHPTRSADCLHMHRKEEVQNQRLELDDLEVKLQETTERLKKLQAKHRRQSQSQHVLGGGRSRPAVRPVSEESATTEDSGGDGRSEDENRVSR